MDEIDFYGGLYRNYCELRLAILKQAHKDWENPRCLALDKGDSLPNHHEIIDFIKNPWFRVVSYNSSANVRKCRQIFWNSLPNRTQKDFEYFKSNKKKKGE